METAQNSVIHQHTKQSYILSGEPLISNIVHVQHCIKIAHVPQTVQWQASQILLHQTRRKNTAM